MPIKKTIKKREKCDPDIWAYLNDEYEGKSLEVFLIEGSKSERESLWNEYRDEILERWIDKKPGTRPSLWWEFDAPRQQMGIWPGCCWDGELPEPRKRLGGTGIVAWLKLNVKPCYFKGIPKLWHSIDYAALPLFESEAAYLKRYGLLSSEEMQRVKENDYEPVSLDAIDYTNFDWENFKRALNEN